MIGHMFYYQVKYSPNDGLEISARVNVMCLCVERVRTRTRACVRVDGWGLGVVAWGFRFGSGRRVGGISAFSPPPHLFDPRRRFHLMAHKGKKTNGTRKFAAVVPLQFSRLETSSGL